MQSPRVAGMWRPCSNSQVLARHFGTDADEVFAVATAARSRVVGLGVTLHAVFGSGKVRSACSSALMMPVWQARQLTPFVT